MSIVAEEIEALFADLEDASRTQQSLGLLAKTCSCHQV